MPAPPPEPLAAVPGASLQQTRRRAVDALQQAGCASAELDARLLICHALGIGEAAYYADPQRPLAADQSALVDALLQRRLAGEPVSRIAGRRAFWQHEFLLSPETLDPRPDSETLIEAALGLIAERGPTHRPLRVLDLGTGSGALLLSLLHELPAASGLGIDVSAEALETARLNAARAGLAGRAAFRRGDWLTGVDERFEVVLCNPPYIPRGEIDGLAPEVACYDPRRALDGGDDGLDPYRVIMPQLAAVLAPDGFAVFEMGAGQHDDLLALAAASGLAAAGGGGGLYADLAGHWRCLAVTAARGK